MILVTLGTQDKSFERLLIEIEKLIEKKVIQEEVIVQAGYTKYVSSRMKIFDYLPKDEFANMISKCNLLITHGGVGSIFDGITHNKKVIAVPRLSKYKEHVNDHQLQVVRKLGEEGYIISCMDVEELENSFQKIKEFHPKKYIGNNSKMINTIENYIKKESISSGSPKIKEYFKTSFIFLTIFYILSYLLKINSMKEKLVYFIIITMV